MTGVITVMRWNRAIRVCQGLVIIAALACGAVSAAPKRVVVLAPNLARISHQLIQQGPSDRVEIVGMVHYRGEPAHFHNIPSVGYGTALNLERIVQRQPDVVLAFPGNPSRALAMLRHFGLRVRVLQARDLGAIASVIKKVGRSLNLAATARHLARKYTRKLDRLRERYRQRAGASPARPKVVVQLSSWPVFVAGGRGVINEAITLCGGRNVFRERAREAVQVSRIKVLAADPRIIVLLYASKEAGRDNVWQQWPDLAAVQHQGIIQIQPQALSQNTPGILDGVSQLCQQIQARKQ